MTSEKYLEEIKAVNAYLVDTARKGKTIEDVDKVKDYASIFLVGLAMGILNNELPDEEDFISACFKRYHEIISEKIKAKLATGSKDE